jgi:hypothetical protein
MSASTVWLDVTCSGVGAHLVACTHLKLCAVMSTQEWRCPLDGGCWFDAGGRGCIILIKCETLWSVTDLLVIGLRSGARRLHSYYFQLWRRYTSKATSVRLLILGALRWGDCGKLEGILVDFGGERQAINGSACWEKVVKSIGDEDMDFEKRDSWQQMGCISNQEDMKCSATEMRTAGKK